MICKWKLQNFKSVYEETDLELAPLTVFAGANSSGKSSIIQSILLVAQTLQNPVYSKSVILNGHIARFGAFNDLATDEHFSESINIGFKIESLGDEELEYSSYGPIYYLEDQEQIEGIECGFSFSAQGDIKDKELLQLQPNLKRSSIKIFRKNEEKVSDEIELIRSNKTIDERFREFKINQKLRTRPEVNSLEFEVLKPTKLKESGRFYRIPVTAKPIGVSFLHFLPSAVAVSYDVVDAQVRRYTQELISPSQFWDIDREIDAESYLNMDVKKILLETFREVENHQYLKSRPLVIRNRFTFSINKLEKDFNITNLQKCYRIRSINQIITEKLNKRKADLHKALKGNKEKYITIEYYPFGDYASDYISTFFKRKLKYLGPLRDEPKPVYQLSTTSDPKDVGFRGENTAAVLDVNKNTKIQYIPSKNFQDNQILRNPVSVTLLEAVADWLGYMGVAVNVKTVDKGKLGHELKVSTPGIDSLHDLTHVGVGVSQILPILVLSLISDQGSTLIFEQPELHLHPKVQTRLADFFVSMALMKKQCIVETHSEYLINRLRYQVVLSEGDELAKDAILYFVDKPEKHSIFNKISINKYGVIDQWPRGFFDESEHIAASMLKASLVKREKEK